MKNKLLIIILLILALIGIPITVYLLGQQQETRSRASANEAPQNVKITNISDNSFTVSWVTADKTIGFVQFGKGQSFDQTAFDDRSTGVGQTIRATHHITLKQLDPSTNYFFKIKSGEGTYDNNGNPYTVGTAPTTSDTPPLPKTLYGKVTNREGLPALEALVYVEILGATSLSTYIKPDGNYLFTLNNARTKDLSTYKTFNAGGEEAVIKVLGASEGQTEFAVNTESIMPIKTLVLGEIGTAIENIASASPALVQPTLTQTPIPSATPTPTPIKSGLTPTPTTTPSPTSIPTAIPTPIPLQIQTPLQNQTFNEQRPQFSGIGQPGQIINILVESGAKITTTLTVGPDGRWTFTPSENLDSGSHKITVSQNGQSDFKDFNVLGATTKGGEELSPGDLKTTLMFLIPSAMVIIGGFLVFVLI